MNVNISYRNRNYRLKSDGNCYILEMINEDGKSFSKMNKYLNKIESIFPILLKRRLKDSNAKNLKQMQKEIINFKKWAEKSFSMLNNQSQTG